MIDPYRTEAPALLSQLLDDQNRRWQQGECVLVETYLTQQPDLHASAESVLALIRNEIRLRTLAGQPVELQEYLSRFPFLEAALREFFAAQRAAGLAVEADSHSDEDSWKTLSSPTAPGAERKPLDGGARPADLEPKWSALLAPGQGPEELGRLGALPILQLLGEGGMGAVFRGRDDELGRDVAVKVLLDRHHGEASLLRRFVEEAQICGQLQHPGVVPVYALGKANDQQPYFTMKLVKGQTLSQLLKERPARAPGQQAADLPRFVTIFGQVCQAVAYAHEKRVIHRDLKPANVMVGAFGEVQVMDWGLAKILPRAEAKEAGPPAEEATVIQTGGNTPSKTFTTSSPDSHTATGDVLGTPAYMATEQARGEIDQLDQRCDVFALGAILCQILTGIPPYDAPALEKAKRGDLVGACLRLEACGADADLVGLARHCLQPQRDDRPRDAGEVAAAVTAYQDSVQARAEEERKGREVAQARAEAERGRAEAERQRRRVTVALAAALLLLVSGGGAAGLWWQHDQALRQAAEAQRQTELAVRREYVNREVATALEEAEQSHKKLHRKLADPIQTAGLLSNLDEWQKLLSDARAAWQRAQTMAGASPDLLEQGTRARLGRLGQQVLEENQRFTLVQQLDAIRLEVLTLVEGKVNTAAASPQYEALFLKELGLDLQRGPIAPLAQQVKQSQIRHALVAALDHWVQVTDDLKLLPRLLEVARRADPDEWRDQVRDEQAWKELKKMQELARNCQPEQHSPQILGLLAKRFGGTERQEEAVTLLRRALLHHPKDFWLYVDLGLLVPDAAEGAGCFLAALALWPNNSWSHSNLGATLYAKGDLEGARARYLKAIEIDPKNAAAHRNLGLVLGAKGDLEGAMACYLKAIDLNPKFTPAHDNLGLVLVTKGNLEGAIARFLKAIEIDPKFAPANHNLGLVLGAKGDLEGAIARFLKAIEIDPKYALAHYDLGVALYAKGELEGAIVHYQKAIDLDPKYAMAHWNLGLIFHQLGRFAEALKELKLGHDLGSKQPGWKFPSAQWVQQCEQLLVLDRKLTAVLAGQAQPASAAEQLTLADLCHRFHQRYASAAKFYADAFAAEPATADNFRIGVRYYAACAAALAGTGQGKDAAKLDPQDLTKWRQQALAWLHADLELWQRQAQSDQPGPLLALAKTMAHWLADPNLARVRDEKELAKLPQEEQPAWLKLWSAVKELTQDAKARFQPVKQWQGTLTSKHREQIHELKLQAGLVYLIDLESPQFDTYLKLQDVQGKTLDENDNIAPNDRNSLLVFTPAQNGTYRLVATSFQQRGTGVYTLTVRQFVKKTP